eukprot:gene2140-3070_t
MGHGKEADGCGRLKGYLESTSRPPVVFGQAVTPAAHFAAAEQPASTPKQHAASPCPTQDAGYMRGLFRGVLLCLCLCLCAEAQAPQPSNCKDCSVFVIMTILLGAFSCALTCILCAVVWALVKSRFELKQLERNSRVTLREHDGRAARESHQPPHDSGAASGSWQPVVSRAGPSLAAGPSTSTPATLASSCMHCALTPATPCALPKGSAMADPASGNPLSPPNHLRTLSPPSAPKAPLVSPNPP